MIIVDVNLLIYAINQQAPQHEAAREWWESALSRRESIGLTWMVVLAFIRITTKPGAFRSPISVEKAFVFVENWLDQPSVSVIEPGPRHALVMRNLLLQSGTGGNLTSDAHLAALAIEHHAELVSFDRDFARFPGLRWRDPLNRQR